MAIPFVLPSYRWPTKAAAETEFQDILRRSGYSVGDRITDPVHDQMLRELVELHPRADEKIRDGIDYFFINRTTSGGRWLAGENQIGIWIHNADGHEDAFGYLKVIRNESAKARVTKALRQAVESSRVRWRDDRFGANATVPSDESGIPLAKGPDAQVIYGHPSFAQLAFTFATSEGGWDKIEVAPESAGGDSIGSHLADAAVKARWRKFHDEHRDWKLVSRSEANSRPHSKEDAWSPHS